MPVSEPRRMRWELHGRLFGAHLRVRPLFWVSCALLGVIYYQYPEIRDEIGGVQAFILWMAAVLFSMLAHELGHALAARLCRVPARIVVSGLGDRVFGLEGLRRWQIVLVALTGPLVSLLLFGVLWAITAYPLPVDRLGQEVVRYIANTTWVLMMINAFWGLLNLLPLWPLDGGRIAVELGTALLGRRGQMLALLLSLLVTLLLTIFVVVWMRLTLSNRFDIHYPVYFAYFCIMALYCYAFWLSGFRALWGDPEPPAGPAT